MRTKALLLSAALIAAGVASSMAQTSNVYSLNIVGYVNIPIVAGKFYALENPLNNAPDNTISNVFQASGFTGTNDAALDQSQILTWDGTAYAAALTYFKGFGWFGGDTGVGQTNLVAPGTGFFFQCPANTTLTFVGSVQLGATNTLPTGFSLIGSPYPAALSLNSAGLIGGDQDNVLRWNSSAAGVGAFTQAIVDFSNYGWLDANAPDGAGPTNGPTLNVAEGIFYLNAGKGVNDGGPAIITWVQNFTVN